MVKRRSKRAKKCSVCQKVLREWNKSGFCSHHYRMDLFKQLRKKRKASHLCIQCGKKVEPIITYPAGDLVPPITRLPARCYACRQMFKIYRETHKQKKVQKIEEEGLATEQKKFVTTQ